MRLPGDPSDDELLEAIREWVGLLAEEDYEAAAAYLYEPEPDRLGAWTPQLIETVIRNYGSIDPMPDGRIFRVTPLVEATGGPSPRHEVDRQGAGAGFIWFDLPLNGTWSDLTATFTFQPINGGTVIVLDDLHVM
jgi:hypothetical protein